MSDPHLRQELEATLHARQEMGGELEPQLVERFVDKIDAEIDRRVDARLATRRPGSGVSLGLPLGSLALAIPLSAIAGHDAGLSGVLLVWIAIVLINVAYALRR